MIRCDNIFVSLDLCNPWNCQLFSDDFANSPVEPVQEHAQLLIEFDITASITSTTRDVRSQIVQEVDEYLSSKTTSDIGQGLRDFPNVRRVFMKFNCIKSSEAICERFFSYAGENFFLTFFLSNAFDEFE